MLRRFFSAFALAMLLMMVSAVAASASGGKPSQVMLISPENAHSLGYISRWFTDLSVPQTNRVVVGGHP